MADEQRFADELANSEGADDAVSAIAPIASPGEADLQRFVATVDDAGGAMLNELANSVIDLRDSGLPDDVIADRLTADLEAFGGLSGYQKLDQALSERLDSVASRYYTRAAEFVYNEGDVPDDSEAEATGKLFLWFAIGSNSCRTCQKRHGRIKTLAEWKRLGLPGSGNTDCRRNCRCTLIPQETIPEYYPEVRQPDLRAAQRGGESAKRRIEKTARADLREHQQRIEEAKREQAERGEPYARSTIVSKLGQWSRARREQREQQQGRQS